MKVSTHLESLSEKPLEIVGFVVRSQFHKIVEHIFVQVRELISGADLAQIFRNCDEQIAKRMESVKLGIDED